MLEWFNTNKDLMIALFGAGGVGTVIIAAYLAKKKPSQSKPTSEITATASDGSQSFAHGGHGDMNVKINETINERDLDRLSKRLELDLPDILLLLRIASDARLGRDEICAATEAIGSDKTARSQLIKKLGTRNDVAVTDLLMRYSSKTDSIEPEDH